LEVDGRVFVLVGTAHISRESTQLVREVIAREDPDCVCVELDRQRYEALAQQRHWESLDLREVIRRKQLATLLANVVLASYQKRLGGALGILPGAELLEAVRTAEEHGVPVRLCDRDVRVTLRRAWRSLSFWKKSQLTSMLLISLFERPEISEEDLRKLREQDVLTELMAELGRAMPELKTVLIDERDAFLSQKMRDAPGHKIVAVVGAGHVAGIRTALAGGHRVDLEAIDRIPPMAPWVKWLGWGIPSLILGSLAWIGISKGAEVAGDNLLYWVMANGIPATLGALAAWGHPITVASAFFVAPVTSLIPVIGAGYVLAFLQAYLVPPIVHELESLTDDVAVPSHWWSNRMLRILLVFLLTTIGSIIGTWVGGYRIVSNLF
jgi:pheromone shutdown-related protein TraB